jgi:hypothetical protein
MNVLRGCAYVISPFHTLQRINNHSVLFVILYYIAIIVLQALLGATVTVWYVRAEKYLRQQYMGEVMLDHAYKCMIMHYVGAVVSIVALKLFIAKSFNSRLIFLVLYILLQFIAVASILAQIISIILLSVDFQRADWFSSCVRFISSIQSFNEKQ